uniref:CND01640 n=1 Tax=Kwoniella heveanensis TaxID=89924 RepID=D2KCB0_9TREE|nr:CND01640 [Kwoniella heveanensis]
MPTGLPFVARPGQEGFDQYGRMLPPDLPEGWDGWGRPLVAAGANAPAAPLAAAAAGAAPPTQTAPPMAMGGGGMPGATTQTRDMQFPSTYASSQGRGQIVPSASSTTMSEGTGRPDQPACFDRPPAKADSYYRYDGFEAFSFPAASLNRAHQLHLPPELVSHDVNEEDWMKFIEDLSREALHGAQHALSRQVRGGQGLGPDPILSEAVHSLLASWAVAFFAPRGIKVYAAQDGRKVLPPPVEPLPTKRGFSHAEEWSDDDRSVEDEEDEYRYAHSSWRDGSGPGPGFGFGDDSDAENEERQARRMDMYLPRRGEGLEEIRKR